MSKFHGSLLKGKNLNYQSFNTTPCGKVNFNIIHPTHITIYSF